MPEELDNGMDDWEQDKERVMRLLKAGRKVAGRDITDVMSRERETARNKLADENEDQEEDEEKKAAMACFKGNGERTDRRGMMGDSLHDAGRGVDRIVRGLSVEPDE